MQRKRKKKEHGHNILSMVFLMGISEFLKKYVSCP
jgi:hypothetical protein